MSKIDPAYFQEANPSAGGNVPAGKDNGCDDALGKPGRFQRNTTTVATEDHDVKELRDKQLGSNGMQSNGFKAHVSGDIPLAPLRGFKESE